MIESTTQSGAVDAPAAADPAATVVVTPLTPGAVQARLEGLAREGKLPGFRVIAPEREMHAAAFGNPFDYRLVVRLDSEGSGARISFALKLEPRMPAIALITLIFTVWPGVWLTDSLLKTYFSSWYRIPTWWWYLPITVIPIPWLYKSTMRRTREAGRASAHELIQRIAESVGGRIDAGS